MNLSPALGADCEADVIVKQPMLHELFDLLGLPMRHTGLSLLQGPSPHPTKYVTFIIFHINCIIFLQKFFCLFFIRSGAVAVFDEHSDC